MLLLFCYMCNALKLILVLHCCYNLRSWCMLMVHYFLISLKYLINCCYFIVIVIHFCRAMRCHCCIIVLWLPLKVKYIKWHGKYLYKKDVVQLNMEQKPKVRKQLIQYLVYLMLKNLQHLVRLGYLTTTEESFVCNGPPVM